MKKQYNNIEPGNIFSDWTVLKFSHKDTKYRKWWQCRCSCGKIRILVEKSLISKLSTSCGHTKFGKRTHGLSKTLACSSWRGMLDRCYNIKARHYDRYGGRGIVVCERWHDFRNFYSDMGERPEDLSLDRIDNNGNYEPSNCRWATREQQSNNRHDNKARTIITY